MAGKELIRTVGALSAAALIWASHNIAGAWLTETLHPVTANLARTNLAALFYVPFLLLYKDVRFSRNHLPRLFTAALCLAIFFQLFYWALWLTGAGHVAIMLALGPAVTAALSVPYLGEKLPSKALVGLVIALVSAILLGFVRSQGSNVPGVWSGAVLAFLGTVAFAHYTLLSKPLLRQYPVPFVLGWTILLGTILLWLYVPVSGVHLGELATISWQQWLVFAYIALFMNVISYILYNKALQRLSAGVTHAVTVYVTTIFALVMARLILAEPVPIGYWLCAGTIAFGVWLTAAAPSTHSHGAAAQADRRI